MVVQTCIDGEFDGWEGDTAFLLCKGDVVVQTDGKYTYHYAYRPAVTLVSSGTTWIMSVEGISDTISVVPVSGFETCMSGEFKEFEHGAVFPLCNGQAWQQTDYQISLALALGPRVLVYRSPYGGGYLMKVLLSTSPRAVRVSRIR